MTTRIVPSEAKFHPVVDLFPPMSDHEFQELVADIRTNGLREPVWIDRTGHVIDGRNRVKACGELKDRSLEARVYDGEEDSIVKFVMSLNLKRRHLNESQRAAVAAKLPNMTRGRPALNTQICGFNKKEKAPPSDGCETAPPVQIELPQAERAKLLSVSIRSVQHAEKVLDSGAPELIDAMESGEVKVSAAATLAELPAEEQAEVLARGPKEARKKAKEIRIRKRGKKRMRDASCISSGSEESASRRSGPYHVVVIDPLRRDSLGVWDLSVEEVRSLELDRLTHENSVVALWTTNSSLHDAYHCLEAGGFTPWTVLTWDKATMGDGDFLREVTEHCVLATRGKPDLCPTPHSNCIREAQCEPGHKPEAFYEIMESLCSGPKLDLFTRDMRPGWHLGTGVKEETEQPPASPLHHEE